MKPGYVLSMLLMIAFSADAVYAQVDGVFSGLQIMELTRRNTTYYQGIYEEQSMILTDSAGNRDTRTLRRYSRVDVEGRIKLLLLCDSPADVAGVALLATRDRHGVYEVVFYLPAHGETIRQNHHEGGNVTLFGTDFSLEDILGEVLENHQYVRRDDIKIDKRQYYLVDVYKKGVDIPNSSPVRRHYIRQNDVYITRTDYFDRHGSLLKVKTMHDMPQVNGEFQPAGMTLMENSNSAHSSLIKINRRVVSDEYVPDEIFTLEWLVQNQPPGLSGRTAGEVDAARMGDLSYPGDLSPVENLPTGMDIH